MPPPRFPMPPLLLPASADRAVCDAEGWKSSKRRSPSSAAAAAAAALAELEAPPWLRILASRLLKLGRSAILCRSAQVVTMDFSAKLHTVVVLDSTLPLKGSVHGRPASLQRANHASMVLLE